MRLFLASIGLACFFSAHFVCFLEGRGLLFGQVPPYAYALGLVLGTVCGAFLLGRGSERRRAAVCACLSAAALLLGAVFLGTGGGVWAVLSSLCGAAMLPTLLAMLFEESRRPGLHLGIVLAAADFFWLHLYLLPTPSTPYVNVLAVGLQVLAGISCTCAHLRPKTGAGRFLRPSPSMPRGLWIRTLGMLCALACICMGFDDLLDLLFYRIHVDAFIVPDSVHMYVWAVYPLTGLAIDRFGADRRIFLVCLALLIVTPSFLAVFESGPFYWFMYFACLCARGIFLVYLLLVFARVGGMHGQAGPCSALVWILQTVSFVLVQAFIARYPGNAPFYLGSIVLMAAYSHLSSQLQQALTLSGLRPLTSCAHPHPCDAASSQENGDERDATARPSEPLRPEETEAASPGGADGAAPSPRETSGESPHEASRESSGDNARQAMDDEAHRDSEDRRRRLTAEFSARYGISMREQDVLLLLAEGCNTAQICERLYISENTVKTHVRQLLRKTETGSRIALVTLYFGEPGDR